MIYGSTASAKRHRKYILWDLDLDDEYTRQSTTQHTTYTAGQRQQSSQLINQQHNEARDLEPMMHPTPSHPNQYCGKGSKPGEGLDPIHCYKPCPR